MAEGRHRKPVSFEEALKANGGDFSSVLTAMLQARQDGKEYLYDEGAWNQFNSLTNGGTDFRKLTPEAAPVDANNPHNFVYNNTNTPAEIAYQQRLGGNPAATSQSVAQEQRSLGTTTSPTMTVSPGTDQSLLSALEGVLTNMHARGQVLNPNVEITPDRAAEFLSQAEREINPYYSGQLKLARESLLSSVNEDKDKLLTNEARTERQYGKDLRTLGENAADVGFAQSGKRLQDEADLAYNTQNTIGDARRTFGSNVGSLSRAFAKQYGTAALPDLSISNAPGVSAGESTFSRPGGTSSLYQLSNDVYSGLVGSDEFARRGAVQSRASELEGAQNTRNAINQARTLTL